MWGQNKACDPSQEQIVQRWTDDKTARGAFFFFFFLDDCACIMSIFIKDQSTNFISDVCTGVHKKSYKLPQDFQIHSS